MAACPAFTRRLRRLSIPPFGSHACARVMKRTQMLPVELRERALGYYRPISKIFVTKDGEVVRVETIEHYPPDTKAAETWLFNRQPAKWKRQREDGKSEERELTIKIVGGAEIPEFSGVARARA